MRDGNDIAPSGDSGELSPRDAAALLEETSRHARSSFDPESPVFAVAIGAFFLLAYGTVWFSLRDQHPAVPALWSLGVFYGLILIIAIVGSVTQSRASAGVSLSQKARRQRFAQGLAIGAAGIGAWTVEGALRSLGVSYEIVYGVFGPTVPLMALAGATAGVLAMRENWLQLGVCIGIIAVAAVSTFFGPAGAWGLTGLGCCLVLLAYAGALVVRQRRQVAAQA